MKRFAFMPVLIIGSSTFIAIAFVILYFFILPFVPAVADNYFVEQKAVFARHWLPLRLHIIFGAIALVTGSINVVRGFRRHFGWKHRVLGRMYGVSVFISAACGIYNAQFAYGGTASRLGFSLLAVLWMTTLSLSVYNILIRRNIPWHAYWMIINFSLTFAAVTLRILLLPFGYPPATFAVAYPIIAWTCWLPNVCVGYWLARKEKAALLAEPVYSPKS